MKTRVVVIKCKIFDSCLSRNGALFVPTNGKESFPLHTLHLSNEYISMRLLLFSTNIAVMKDDLILNYMRLYSSEKINGIIKIGLLPI